MVTFSGGLATGSVADSDAGAEVAVGAAVASGAWDSGAVVAAAVVAAGVAVPPQPAMDSSNVMTRMIAIQALNCLFIDFSSCFVFSDWPGLRQSDMFFHSKCILTSCYPFTAPIMMPLMKYFCIIGYTSKMGKTVMMDIVIFIDIELTFFALATRFMVFILEMSPVAIVEFM